MVSKLHPELSHAILKLHIQDCYLLQARNLDNWVKFFPDPSVSKGSIIGVSSIDTEKKTRILNHGIDHDISNDGMCKTESLI